jgi:hypothetical protein
MGGQLIVTTLRPDLNVGTTWSLPAWSAGPHGDERSVLEAAKAAGYRGIQGANPRRCRDLGLVPTTFELQPTPGGLADKAKRMADAGFACCTLMLGTGYESDDEAARLAEEVLDAGAHLPIYVETHRATVTQDIRRTVQLVARFPELRFNGDFSHWYTGLDLAFGGIDVAIEFAAPVLDRVRYLHGRIASSGCIQVDIGDGAPERTPSVAHFVALWTRAFEGFIAHAAEDPSPPPGMEIGFAPELLPPEVGYARLVPDPSGIPREESDRWTQAIRLTEIATECFAAARARDRFDP